jgi:hypothetical protein
MQELLQRIDPDYYRTALLLMVRTELVRLREGRPAVPDVKRHSKNNLGKPCSADARIQLLMPTAIAESFSSKCDDTA